MDLGCLRRKKIVSIGEHGVGGFLIAGVASAMTSLQGHCSLPLKVNSCAVLDYPPIWNPDSAYSLN